MKDIKKRYEDYFVEDGSTKVQGSYLDVWDFIETELETQENKIVKDLHKISEIQINEAYNKGVEHGKLQEALLHKGPTPKTYTSYNTKEEKTK